MLANEREMITLCPLIGRILGRRLPQQIQLFGDKLFGLYWHRRQVVRKVAEVEKRFE
jgi:hypothetical protein